MNDLLITENGNAYAALLAQSERIGLPVHYKTDLTEHLKNDLENTPDGTAFVVLFRDTGVDYTELSSLLAAERFMNWRQVYGDEGQLFLWDGSVLTPTTFESVMIAIGENVVSQPRALRLTEMVVPSLSEMLGSLPYSVRSHPGTDTDCSKKAERIEFIHILPGDSLNSINQERSTPEGKAKWDAFLNPKHAVKDVFESHYNNIVRQFVQHSQNPAIAGGVVCHMSLFTQNSSHQLEGHLAFFSIRRRDDSRLVANGAVTIVNGQVRINT